MNIRVILAALTLAVLGTDAVAQAQPEGERIRVRGTIESLDGDNLTVIRSDGSKATLTVPADARINAPVAKSWDDVQPGVFLASAGETRDGKLYAVEVRIFTSGNIQGRQFAWDLGADSLMTNATVTEVSEVPEGHLVKVEWPDGQGEYIVPPEVPIIVTEAADTSVLVAGAYVVINGNKLADGTMTANSISAERNGLKFGM